MNSWIGCGFPLSKSWKSSRFKVSHRFAILVLRNHADLHQFGGRAKGWVRRLSPARYAGCPNDVNESAQSSPPQTIGAMREPSANPLA